MHALFTARMLHVQVHADCVSQTVLSVDSVDCIEEM